MAGGLGLLAAASLPLAAQAQAQANAPGDTPDAALDKLMQGNERYIAGQMRERDFSAGRAARAESQAPFAAILGCADSASRRSSPSTKVRAVCSWCGSPATSSRPMVSLVSNTAPPCSAPR